MSSRSPSPTSHIVPCGNTERERGDDRLAGRRADVVGVRPLAEQAVGLEPRSRRLEELAGEQRRHARHPRIRRLGDDDVVALRRQQQMRPAVADDQPDGGVARAALPLSRSKKRDASTTSGEISTTSARRTVPDASAEPTVTPLPSPMTATSCASPWSEHGQQAEQTLGQHVAGVATRRPCRRSPATRAGEPADADGRRRRLPCSTRASPARRTVSRSADCRGTGRICRRRWPAARGPRRAATGSPRPPPARRPPAR